MLVDAVSHSTYVQVKGPVSPPERCLSVAGAVGRVD